jgi:superfamily I DNA/RNA helicase
VSERLYLRLAEELRGNEGQWAAYESKGHCVVLAGPGSGKTKTLTLKLARILAEDVAEPRGVACITYNNECARELETRLQGLGIEPGGRIFIGTVHSFSLTQILMPYAAAAGLGLPEGFKVATDYERRAALEDAFRATVGGPENPQNWRMRMDNYRRLFLDRSIPEWHGQDGQLARLTEAYEDELRRRAAIDFEDMPLLAVRAVRQNPWLQQAILAKYPVLAVDEYQDLGRALHGLVMGLCFRTGIRLFAVGDVDQSIYGFVGAEPLLLQRLSQRPDVDTVRLRLNYRCGSKIVAASSYALGEDRDYAAPDDAKQGTIYFHPGAEGLAAQAEHLFARVIPEAQARIEDLTLGEIAILYPAASIGDAVQEAADRHGFETIRTDNKALYPRGSALMRWLEACAGWCCGGWRTGKPRFSRLLAQGTRLFREAILTVEQRQQFQRQIMGFLWTSRDETLLVHGWLTRLRAELIDDALSSCRTLGDEIEILENFMARVDAGGDRAGMTLGQFSGQGVAADRINLSTLHSAKGREFQVVVLFGMDAGRIPWNNPTPKQLRESQRLFYVGFTRAKSEIHMMYSAGQPSRFVTEVQKRLVAP